MSKKQYGVLGLGRFGSKVARELFFKGYEVVAMDKDEDVIQAIKDQVTHAFIGDIIEEAALREAGILDCDVVIIAESNNMESNIISAQICKSAGVPSVICKAQNTIHGNILNKIGVDHVIFPEQDTAIKLVNKLTSQGVLDYFDIGENLTIIGTKALPEWVGKKLEQLDLRNRFNVTVLAIRRDKENLVIPAWSTTIEKSDVLVLFGREDSFKELKLDITHKT